MELYAVVLAIKIISVCSASNIPPLNENSESLMSAAANIVDKCFGSIERWPELLIIPDQASDEILGKIHRESKTSNSVVFPNPNVINELTQPGKCNDHSNTSLEQQRTKATAVLIVIYSLGQLEAVLSFMETGIQTIWRPESYFLIVLETRCDVEEYNDMFKVIWDYWVLDAVILCLSNDPVNRNEGEIELYTFNPYSGDRSLRWETIIHENIEVSINPGNFTHSWYILKQRFTRIESFEDCGELFFDKTSNLDGYVIPISVPFSEYFSEKSDSTKGIWSAAYRNMLKTIANLLRFNFAQILDDPDESIRQIQSGSYFRGPDNLCRDRAHLAPHIRGIRFQTHYGMTYPHDINGLCFASWKNGNRPQWTNLADAKHIWISLGIGVLFSTVVLYIQNKSDGIVSAFLDAERIIIGTTIVRTSTVIKHRIILGSIFLVVLVVDGAIRGRFISILTVVNPYPNLDTLEQLKEQNDVEVYGHRVLREMITDPQIEARLNITLGFPECLTNRRDKERQRACFAHCAQILFTVSNLTDLHQSSTPVWTSYVAFLTAMHWPMTNRYSLEVQKLVETGIFKKWQSDTYRELEVNEWKLKRAAEPPYVRPTKLNDLLPVFILLFVGLSIGLIVFAREIKDGVNIRSDKS